VDRRTAAAKVRLDVAQESPRCPCSLFSLDFLPFGASSPPPRLESATSFQPEHFILIFPICCCISLLTTFVPVPPSLSCTLPHNYTHSDSSLFAFLPSLSLFTARSSFPSFALTIVQAGRNFGTGSRLAWEILFDASEITSIPSSTSSGRERPLLASSDIFLHRTWLDFCSAITSFRHHFVPS
jgi:hypothetical protein